MKEQVRVDNKTITFHWESSPLTDLVHQVRLERDPILLNSLMKNINKRYYGDLHWRLGIYGAKNHEKNFIQSIFGETGAGKSNVMVYLGDYVMTGADKTFTVDDICFPRTELLQRMKDVIGLRDLEEITEEHISQSRGQAFSLDEQKRGNFGEGSYREAQELQTIIDVFRRLQTFNTFISPELHGIKISHFYLEAWAIDYEKAMNKCILYDKSLFPLGYILTRQARDEIWKPYSRKKNKFISETLHGTERSRQMDSMVKAKKIHDSDAWQSGIAKSKTDKLQIVKCACPNLSIAEQESLYALTVMISRAKKMGMDMEDLMTQLM